VHEELNSLTPFYPYINKFVERIYKVPKFSGHRPMVERSDKFENGYIGVRGW